jgi:hypothetical protein
MASSLSLAPDERVTLGKIVTHFPGLASAVHAQVLRLTRGHSQFGLGPGSASRRLARRALPPASDSSAGRIARGERARFLTGVAVGQRGHERG